MMTTFPPERELVLDRFIDAPREAVFRCWTESDLVKRWFAPAPWSVAQAEIDPCVGGANNITMRGPDGQEMPRKGVFLEVVRNERIVTTDAFGAGWEPGNGAPFMVTTVTLKDEGAGTRYVARVRHWTVEATRQHEEMGFHTGWNQCADQLESLAKTI
jgi:uncharacterized protein YndB with AHSA1/START domain